MCSYKDHEIFHPVVEYSRCQHSHSSQLKHNLNSTKKILNFISSLITHTNVTSRIFKFMEYDLPNNKVLQHYVMFQKIKMKNWDQPLMLPYSLGLCTTRYHLGVLLELLQHINPFNT
jgi:hypothetical protein